MNKNKLIVFVFAIMLLTSFVSAQNTESLGTHKQGEIVEIPQTCSNCTFVNLQSVTFPNSTIQILNASMTKNGFSYNYSFSDTTILGFYIITTCGDVDGTPTCVNFDFSITPNGEDLTIESSIIQVVLLVSVFVFFILSLFVAITMPYSNEVDVKGAVFNVTRRKYIKISFIFLTYVLFIWFLNVLIAASVNYANLTLYSGFFGFIFTTLNNLALPFGIFLLIVMFFEIIRDANIQKNISKFGKSRQ